MFGLGKADDFIVKLAKHSEIYWYFGQHLYLDSWDLPMVNEEQRIHLRRTAGEVLHFSPEFHKFVETRATTNRVEIEKFAVQMAALAKGDQPLAMKFRWKEVETLARGILIAADENRPVLREQVLPMIRYYEERVRSLVTTITKNQTSK
jgi:hypothetical protein